MAAQTFFLFLSIAIAFCISQATGNASNSSGCDRLAAKYSTLTFFPNSSEYENQVANAWSQTCVFRPYCVFEPESAKDLAGALVILEASQTKFAVRSGGHLAKPGANGIADGVIIALARITTMKLVNNNTVAQLGPGLRWGTVYNWTSSYGLGIAGGRFGDVGVPGLLLGGGITWFGSQYGWSMNSVLNYEVVLATGSIVNANAQTNSDLFWALKGGSSNFGIVTRFDLATFPVTDMYGGLAEYVYTPENYDNWVHAVANYVDPQGGSADVLSSLDPITIITPSTGEFLVASFFSHRGSDVAPACFSNFTNVTTSFSDVDVRPSLIAFQADADDASFADRSRRQLPWITGMKAKPESVYLANQTFVTAALSQLTDIPNATTSITYQLISHSWLVAARASGGDAIDLDPANGGFIALQIESGWSDAVYDQRFIDFATNLVADIDRKAKAAGLYYPFNYINDAGSTQLIYGLYGGGKSLPKMEAIAKKYDPSGVFQKLEPGGFKLFG
ncbi:FAD-binding domain-containing protein [Glonium stellatum]|uniref:FAD-binding domain-containing protein n=1 Tax=Glonium stellatum TaxID=574774 RepID=A0A8E2F727_9PEZI|nr:FAD-binding domain-containing protein [Glonium stellatum]